MIHCIIATLSVPDPSDIHCPHQLLHSKDFDLDQLLAGTDLFEVGSTDDGYMALHDLRRTWNHFDMQGSMLSEQLDGMLVGTC